MDAGEDGRPRSRGRRYAIAAISVVGALGIFSAIGSNVVDGAFPSVWEQVTGTDSLRVNVRDASDAGDGFTLATFSPDDVAGRLEEVDSCESLFAAAMEADAARVGESFTDLVIEGGTYRDVAIVDLRPEIVDRAAAMDGAEIRCASAGIVAGIGLSFDFDEPMPVARRISDGPDDGTPFFEHGDVIALTQGEVQPIQIKATSTRDYVAWRLLADLVIDGESRTVSIDDNGRPFQITPPSPKTGYRSYYEWLWFESPPRLHAASRPFSQ